MSKRYHCIECDRTKAKVDLLDGKCQMCRTGVITQKNTGSNWHAGRYKYEPLSEAKVRTIKERREYAESKMHFEDMEGVIA